MARRRTRAGDRERGDEGGRDGRRQRRAAAPSPGGSGWARRARGRLSSPRAPGREAALGGPFGRRRRSRASRWTRSARRTGRREPTWSTSPLGDRGLERHLGRSRSPRALSSRSAGSPRPGSAGGPGWSSAASDRRHAFMTWASSNVRRNDSPIRPIPCESELTIADGAQLVERALRSHPRLEHALADQLEVARDRPREPVVEHRHRHVLDRRVDPNGNVGVVDEQRIDGSRTRPRRSGHARRPCPRRGRRGRSDRRSRRPCPRAPRTREGRRCGG